MVWREVRGAYQWIAVDTTGCGMPKCPPVRHRRSPLSLGPGLPRYVAGMHLGMSRHPRVCRILAGHGGVGHAGPSVGRVCQSPISPLIRRRRPDGIMTVVPASFRICVAVAPKLVEMECNPSTELCGPTLFDRDPK